MKEELQFRNTDGQDMELADEELDAVTGEMLLVHYEKDIEPKTQSRAGGTEE